MDTIIININEAPEAVLIKVNNNPEAALVSVVEVNDTVMIQAREVLGKDGASAYEMAVSNGFTGSVSAWLLSLKGATGSVGGVFIFAQSAPLTIWNVNHNLGFYPNVSVIDSSNRMVLTDINYIDNNNLQVMVANAFSGTAYLS